MKRSGLLLLALSVAGSGLIAADLRAQKAPPPPPYVVVDPNDLRQPVPDPEQGLTEKYDGKVVRFTGAARRWSLDKRAKTCTYELHHDIIRIAPIKGRKVAVREETIVVPVTFRRDEPRLRAGRAGFTLTVEGKGAVTADGGLIITEAVLVPTAPTSRAVSKK